MVVRDLAPDEALDQALVEQEVVDDRRELADPEHVAARGSGAGSSGSGAALHSFEKRFRWARSMDLLYVRGHL